MSINVVGSHLAEHAANPARAEAMDARLVAVNAQWDNVCEQATLWQTRLQTALLEVKMDLSNYRNTCVSIENNEGVELIIMIVERRVPRDNPRVVDLAGGDHSQGAGGRASGPASGAGGARDQAPPAGGAGQGPGQVRAQGGQPPGGSGPARATGRLTCLQAGTPP